MLNRLTVDSGELVKVALKTSGGWEKVGGWVEGYQGCWVLWSLCVFGCISVVVVEGVCVRGLQGTRIVYSW
jgi:hypothetical protein